MKKMKTIKIEKRENANSNVNMRLRKSGYLPASIYGKGIETTSVTVKTDELKRVLTTLGRNAVFNLAVANEEPVTVIIKEIQHAPLSREYLHVDFQKVSLSEGIHTEVPIKIVGAEILDAKKLILMRQTNFISLKGFPQDIPDHVEIDVSALNVGESIHISDLKLSKKVVVENDPSVVIVSVSESRVHETEEEIETVKESPTV
ncbi:MAG: 50S ribosomal protein L25 [Eubacteriaceae bacterium]|nr:50S ribosomal protein L25 [Eubacteriaceae bacterium]